MHYPILTLFKENNIEVTASRPDSNGSFVVCVEQWNSEKDDFDSFQIRFPQCKLVARNGFLNSEFSSLYTKITKLQNVISEYVDEQEQQKNNLDLGDY